MKKVLIVASAAILILLSGCKSRKETCCDDSKYEHLQGKFYRDTTGSMVRKVFVYTSIPEVHGGKEKGYYCYRRVPEIDLETYHNVGYEYYADKARVYYQKSTTEGMHIWVLEGADPNTFQIMNDSLPWLARDEDQFFDGGYELEGMDPDNMEFIGSFILDSDQVFYGRSEIDDVHRESFEIFREPDTGELSGYSRDHNHLYDQTNTLSAEIDLETVEYLGGGYFKDKNHVYDGDRLVSGADLNSFKALEKGYAKDKKHVFYGDEIIEGADPESFTTDLPIEECMFGAQDKNRKYCYGKPME